MRDPNKKLVGGVCAGLAKYLNMDVNLVRILTVVISLFTGIPIVLYLIALFVMPEERNEPQPPYVNGPQPGAYGAGYSGQAYQQPTYGTQPPAQPADQVWGSAGAPWEQPQTAAPTPAPAPEQQAWQQPSTAESVSDPGSEATSYDTAPTAPAAAEESPATAAPEDSPAASAEPEPEPVPESDASEAPAEEASTWESAPADPETGKKDQP